MHTRTFLLYATRRTRKVPPHTHFLPLPGGCLLSWRVREPVALARPPTLSLCPYVRSGSGPRVPATLWPGSPLNGILSIRIPFCANHLFRDFTVVFSPFLVIVILVPVAQCICHICLSFLSGSDEAVGLCVR
ncbi:hypothetical protein BCV70DRAFT_102780 [Testicularia cyperi]|uniref:Uncharacterized protein n=1 Tax=Testicularia cyperi TaxID=1882483 RepID=A0A317XPX1_9BASI|nr:hypothetical protein BCV70DRAFT_102780 [Testicularia cyperi]